ncbi:MAG: hypothetical protein RDU59_11835 [Thermodesulfobacteriota bacterium]|nr:hypothetical protein [Thermodesulfobacteriota bacterium]
MDCYDEKICAYEKYIEDVETYSESITLEKPTIENLMQEIGAGKDFIQDKQSVHRSLRLKKNAILEKAKEIDRINTQISNQIMGISNLCNSLAAEVQALVKKQEAGVGGVLGKAIFGTILGGMDGVIDTIDLIKEGIGAIVGGKQLMDIPSRIKRCQEQQEELRRISRELNNHKLRLFTKQNEGMLLANNMRSFKKDTMIHLRKLHRVKFWQIRFYKGMINDCQNLFH